MKNILIILLLLSGRYGYGQDWFSKHRQGEETAGYIITIAGDTISGMILYDYPLIMQKRISFINKGNPDPDIFQPKDIRGYSVDDMIWESVIVNMDTYNGPVKFNRFGILYSGKGPIHLIRMFTEKDKIVKSLTSTKAETIYKGIKLTRDENSLKDLYIKKMEHPAEDVNNNDFKRDFIVIMSGMVSENKDLSAKIQNKEYKIDDLDKIVDEYNRWFMEQRYNRTH